MFYISQPFHVLVFIIQLFLLTSHVRVSWLRSASEHRLNYHVSSSSSSTSSFQILEIPTCIKWFTVAVIVASAFTGLLHIKNKQKIIKLFSVTRLLSNLRPTTRECVHLVTSGHVRSCDKDGGYTIRSAIAKNPCYTPTSWLYVL